MTNRNRYPRMRNGKLEGGGIPLHYVDEKNKEIVDSLEFAKKIQKVILPTEERFQELLPDCFVFFQPKDIVSGDFYWIQEQGGWVLGTQAKEPSPSEINKVLGNQGLTRSYVTSKNVN